jgi:hypothetical protein
MQIRDYMAIVAASSLSEWELIFRPTYRHRFMTQYGPEGVKIRTDVDQHVLALTFKPNISISMAYGMVDTGNYEIPARLDIANENARTILLDCFLDGQLVHRELILRADRQRISLPMPTEWTAAGLQIPAAKSRLVRLIHNLAGPPTDYDEGLKLAGMEEVETPWP